MAILPPDIANQHQEWSVITISPFQHDLSNKVPDDIACCGLGSNCVHTQTHEQFSSHIHERR